MRGKRPAVGVADVALERGVRGMALRERAGGKRRGDRAEENDQEQTTDTGHAGTLDLSVSAGDVATVAAV
jgi:hypothetical protein